MRRGNRGPSFSSSCFVLAFGGKSDRKSWMQGNFVSLVVFRWMCILRLAAVSLLVSCLVLFCFFFRGAMTQYLC